MATKTGREARDAADEEENDDLVIVSGKEDNCTTTMGAYSGDPQSKVLIQNYKVKSDEPYMTKDEQLIPADGFLVVTLDNKYSRMTSKEVEFHVTDRRGGTDKDLFPEMKSMKKNYDIWGTMMKGRAQIYLDDRAFTKSENKCGFKISVGASSEAKFSIRVSAGQKIVLTASVERYDVILNASYQINAFQVLEAVKQQKRETQDLKAEKRELLQTKDLLTEKVAAAKKAAMTLTEKIAQGNSEIKRKEKEIHSLKDAKESLKLKDRSLSVRVKTLDNTLESERAMHSAKVKSMEDVLASERAEHHAKEAFFISQNRDLEDAIGRERDLQSANLELRKEMKRKTEEASVVAANLTTTRAQLKEIQERFNELRKEMKRKTEEASIVAANLTTTRAQLKQIQERFNELRKEMKRKTEEASAVAANLTTTRAQLKQIQERFQYARTSLASLIQRHTSAGERSLHTMWQRAGAVHRIVLWIDTSSASDVTELIQKAQMKGVTVVQMRTCDAAQKYLSSETGKVLLRSPDVSLRAVFCNLQPKNERKTAMEAVRFASDLRDREISIPLLIYSRSSDMMHTAHSLVKESDIVHVLLTRDLARCSDFLTFEDKTLETVSSSGTKSNDDDDEDDDTSKAVSNWTKALDMLASMGFKNRHMCLELLEKHTTNSPDATLEERVSAVATRMCDFATGRGIGS
eukprot:g1213.t1